MNKWSHLPNAHLIDWVLESLKTNPDSWNAACDAVRDAARDAARNAARVAARNAARNAVWDVTRNATWDVTRNAARTAAWAALAALVSFDDCDFYLAMSYEQLKVYAILSEKPQAVLLLPLKWVQKNETMVTST